MHLLFAGGGTGGHLFPGLALARELRRRYPDSHSRFIGSRRKLEISIVSKSGFPFVSIPAVPFPKAPWRWPAFALCSLASYRQSARIIRALDVDLVIALGGYAAYWPALAAKYARVPVVVLEQNVIPGRANRRIARWACAACVQFPDSQKLFPKEANIVLTGNPIRQEIFTLSRQDGRRHYNIPENATVLLILGGSQGAAAINSLVVGALRQLARIDRLFVIHQTGSQDQSRVRAAYQVAGPPAMVRPYFHELPWALAAADLVVARAGATSIAEICARGLPSILIPFPAATEDHQRANARQLEALGAAVLLDQHETGSRRLFETIKNILGDPDRMRRMSDAAKKLAADDAVERVADICADALNP